MCRRNILLSLIFLFYFAGNIFSQLPKKDIPNNLPKDIFSSIPFTTVPNDPYNTRIYTLENGLKVYMSINKNAPRIQTYIAVRAGSKNDPKDATGLAHYLEHMLFKGTDVYGSLDFSKEQPMLQMIEDLYEKYRNTKDETQRKKIYRMIDSVSGVAAKYAIANEYDKMMSGIGAKGTNAYTWVEQTVYVNDIPTNQLENWLTIEAERFRNPIMRIFHTELEAVYEEKNISLDSDQDKLWETLFAGLWQKHTYGTQTTIGTIEHLKNPSIKKIKEYYNKHYVPNNMAICMSGDIDPDATIKMINEKFGSWKKKPVEQFVPAVEEPITKPWEKSVTGPNQETVLIGYRFQGAGSQDADMITLLSQVLSNGTAGVLDLDLNQEQKVLGSSAFSIIFKDYSALILNADPKEGQKLEEVKEILLKEIEKIKKGDFPDWILAAVISNLKLDQTRGLESNDTRASAFVDAFVKGEDWEKVVNRIERLSKITKSDLVAFANKFLQSNYVVVYKRTGEDSNVQKVVKPEITPVEVNRNEQSPFVKKILQNKPKPIDPVFVNYETSIKRYYYKNRVPVYYVENTENGYFSLSYRINVSSFNDKRIPIAVDYLNYLGNSQFGPTALKQEFYKLACSYNVYTADDHIFLSIDGLAENMETAMQIFEQLLRSPAPNKEALTNLISDNLKKRADAKLDQNAILWGAMYNYARYGSDNPNTYILSEKELKSLQSEELITIIKSFLQYDHEILFYGPTPGDKLISYLDMHHPLPEKFIPIPPPHKFKETVQTGNTVYIVDFDMKQAEILMYSTGIPFDPSLLPKLKMFNEYFGSGMSSIVFQDLRESKALAYSVFSAYTQPTRKDRPFIIQSYIGTQSDKLPEAMKGMFDLMTVIPESEISFGASKDALLQNLRTQRISKSAMIGSYLSNKKLGITHDYRKDIFDAAANFTFNDVREFHKTYMANKNFNIMILGKKSTLDIKTLEKYGPVKFLTLEDVFGY
jgi:predicted Zn-dependent peptidase